MKRTRLKLRGAGLWLEEVEAGSGTARFRLTGMKRHGTTGRELEHWITVDLVLSLDALAGASRGIRKAAAEIDTTHRARMATIFNTEKS